MRSYHKVYAKTDQSLVSLDPTNDFDAGPFYMQVVLRSRAIDFVNGYNFLGSCAFAQTGGAFPIKWVSFNSNGSQNISFSGQQLANAIFPLRAYAGHPLN
jgi:hypothetical protein